jgi:hypothetical protein
MKRLLWLFLVWGEWIVGQGNSRFFVLFWGCVFVSRCFAIFVNIEREKVRARMLGT